MKDKLHSYTVEMVETIFHRWTVEANSEQEAEEIALNGCPDDTCNGESEEVRIVEIDGQPLRPSKTKGATNEK